MKKVLVIEDTEIWRLVIKDALEKSRFFQICHFCHMDAHIIESIHLYCPDIILLDYHLPINNGGQIIEKIRKSGIQTCIIVFSILNDPLAFQQLLLFGANGCISKSKYNILCDEILNILNFKWKASFIKDLNYHDFELWKYIVKGKTNWELADLLHVEESTIEYRIKKLSQKMGIPNKRMYLILNANYLGLWA